MKKLHHRNERGVALVSVLILMTLLGVMALSAAAIMQYSSAESDTFTSLSRSYYTAESAANRLIFYTARDVHSNPDRKLGELQYAGLKDGIERFMADSTMHSMDIYGENVKWQITDTLNGIDVSGTNPERNLSLLTWPFEENSEEQEKFRSFTNMLLDYIDKDDFVRNGSAEAFFYRSSGIPVLPRNRPMQFREEMRLLPSASVYFKPDDYGRLRILRLIPPQNMRPLSGRSNFFSAPPEVLSAQCRLSSQELAELENALSLWRNEQKPVSSTLSPNLLARAVIAFSFNESGVYTFYVDSSADGVPGRKLSMSLRISMSDQILEFYEYFSY